MDKKLLANVIYYDFLKLLWAVLMFFLALVIWVKEWGEPFSMIATDYYDSEIVQEEAVENEEHWVATKSISEKLASVCALHNDWCDKIVRSWNFSDTEKIGYVSQYFVIFDFLDKKLAFWWDIKKEFKTLIINSNAGKRRGGATWTRITINLDSFTDIAQFWQVLTHEFWHIVDLAVLNGGSRTMNYDYTEFSKKIFVVNIEWVILLKISQNVIICIWIIESYLDQWLQKVLFWKINIISLLICLIIKFYGTIKQHSYMMVGGLGIRQFYKFLISITLKSFDSVLNTWMCLKEGRNFW